MLRDGGSGPGELKFQRQADNKFDANAIGVQLDGHNVGYLPKKLATFLAPAMDAHVVDVSLEMGGGCWGPNNDALRELKKYRADKRCTVKAVLEVHLSIKVADVLDEASELAVGQMHAGLDKQSNLKL